VPQTIFERALEFVTDGTTVGLGSGRAANRFTELLGERIRGGLNVRGVPTSEATAEVAEKAGVPLVELEAGMPLSLVVDGADEVDPQLDLIKGYGRALVREKIVAAAARQTVILVGREKLVPQLGTRGKLPIEVVPFAVPLVMERLRTLGGTPTVALADGRPLVTDNGNHIVDCAVRLIANPAALERSICAIPGVVDTGLFLSIASIVLVGDSETFALGEELRRPTADLSKSAPEVAR
jgi:ribose 5-phosphate isomerase A